MWLLIHAATGTSRFDIDLVGREYSGFSTRVVNVHGHELGWVLFKYIPLLAENENYSAYGVVVFGSNRSKQYFDKRI